MGQRRGVNPLLISVFPIETYLDDNHLGGGTGFFYRNNDTIFIVTNRHVFVHEEEDHYPNRIRIKLHIDATNIQRNRWLEIPIQNNEPLWRDFGRLGPDIAALPIHEEVIEECVILSFSNQNLPPENLVVGLGDDVLVIGYPLGFHDNLHNLPISRIASVASEYPIPFRGEPFFLIDGRLHPGTSGSPVITKDTGMHRTTDALVVGGATFLLGIHSHSWPVPDGEDPLDLNAVWFGSSIEELTS